MDDFFQTASAPGRVRAREEMQPKQSNCLVIFFRPASGCGETAKRIAHLIGGLFHGWGFREIDPRDVQVRSMMEILVCDVASLERAR